MDIPNLHKMRLAFIICMFSILVTTLSGQIVSADGKGVIFNEETIIDLLAKHRVSWTILLNANARVKYSQPSYRNGLA